MTVTKSLDAGLAAFIENSGSGVFLLADAKDADMAMGIAAPGKAPGGKGYRGLQDYRERIRENVAQGLVDIVLMSASTSGVLTCGEGIFENSPVTPAVRANDSTDIWWAAGSAYPSQPSLPFRSADIGGAMLGGADLGLYSITFNNDAERDRETLEAYAAFRREADAIGFRHFLEVFDPNAPLTPIPDLPRFMNDNIIRTLAGIAGKSRPIFLKVVYHGPAAMEELAGYDTDTPVGILGGASGTTHDAFHQLWEAKKYGARVALYGRMINDSEHQPSFIQHLRWIADGEIVDAAEAVRSYHGALEKIGVQPHRALDADLERTRDLGSHDI